MRRFFVIIACLSILLGFTSPARAQAAVELSNVGVTYTFGEQVTFSAKILSKATIQTAYLLFQVKGDQNTRSIPLDLGADGTARYAYQVKDGLLRPFSRIYFWYHLLFADGSVWDGSHYYFQYDDNRFPWQDTEGFGLRIHWYAGDVSFGQAALDAAHAGYQAIQAILPVVPGEPVDVYIYASAVDVQNMLSLGGYSWVGGHASPDLDVVLVSIAPGETQSIEMERQIPHELAHVILYRRTGPAYANLPGWLAEGIASQVEQYPNADYAQVLSVSTKNGTLLPIASLCGLFPVDASGAILAYAESDSFVRYLRERFGTSSLQSLIKSYTDGLTCDQGAVQSLGLPLAKLEEQWRAAVLGEKVSGLAFQNLLPYLILLGLVLLIPVFLFGLNLRK